MAVRPVDPPALDGGAFEAPLRTAFPTAKGTPRAVYSGPLPRFLQWVRGEGVYDGKGLADAVKTNATEQNDIKRDIDEHAERLNRQADRLAALEARPATTFP